MIRSKYLRVHSKILFYLIVFVICPCTFGKIICVDDDAEGAGDGGSWKNAYTFLQDALADANYSEKPVEIHVARGVYKPDQGDNLVPEDQDATFQLMNGVSLLGGFAGISHADSDLHNIEKYRTILSGDLNGDDKQPLGKVYDSKHFNRTDNSYHIVTGLHINQTAVLDGFILTGSRSAAMHNQFSDPTVRNCTFTGNLSILEPDIQQQEAISSKGILGAGMCNIFSNPVIADCTFSDNFAGDGDGHVRRTFLSKGGGLYNSDSNPTLTDCVFRRNTAGCGGGMYNQNSQPILTNCFFTYNSAQDMAHILESEGYYGGGGGMYNYLGRPSLINCTFIRNSASEGGGIRNFEGSPRITNCLFSGNEASRGGGVHNENNCETILVNCTFANNLALYGNALSCDSHEVESFKPPHVRYSIKYPSNVELNNCIIWDGTDGIYNNDDSKINFFFSNIQSGWPGEDNISADPLFVDPDGDDGIFGTIDDDLRLSAGSPCIDKGSEELVPESVNTDISGNPRSIHAEVDIGAYESPTPSLLISSRHLIVPEGGHTFFTIALSEPPLGSVAVKVTYHSGDIDVKVKSGAVISFNETNFDIPQTVIIESAEDSDNFNGISRIKIGSEHIFDLLKVVEADNEPNAFTNLQDAIGLARKVDVQEIRVAQGVYWPDQGNEYISGDRAATFQLMNGVAIRGGYAGVAGLDSNARDIALYKAILSGDLLGDDVNSTDPQHSGPNNLWMDNSSSVVIGTGTNSTAVLDGFTITSAFNNAIYNRRSSPTIANCTLTENGLYGLGRGVRNYDSSSPTFTNCIFRDNFTAFNGGGMHNSVNCNPELTNCTFSGNTAKQGAALYNEENSNPIIMNCKFTGNSAAYGGAIYCENSSNTIYENCIFENNIAKERQGISSKTGRKHSYGGFGGGIYNHMSDSILTDCTFSSNSTKWGGGIYNTGSKINLTKCRFSNNSARDGGALSNNHSDLSFVNCIFSTNTGAFHGGALSNYDCILALTNCTFSQNSASHGNAISFYSHDQDYSGSAVLSNSILWDEGNEISYHDRSEITITYSDIQGGFMGEGNIDMDPLFVNPDAGDYHLKSQTGRWDPSLQNWVTDDVTSLCIDAGDPAVSVISEPIPNGDRARLPIQILSMGPSMFKETPY